MGTPFDELIAQLNNLVEKFGTPHGQLKLLVDADELPEVLEARAAMMEIMGMVPFPGGNPDFEAITGAIGQANGEIDNITQTYQAVREQATTAMNAVRNARDVVASVIISLQQGHQ